MDEWLKWIGSILVLAVSGMFTRLYFLMDRKANKESTDARFDDVLKRIDRQQFTIEKHMDACDSRQREQQDTLNQIREHAAQTEKNIAVLTARFERK